MITTEKEFDKLVEKVRKIDINAAIWLRDNRKNLDYSNKLVEVMEWKLTSQGFDYWANIEYKLKGQK